MATVVRRATLDDAADDELIDILTSIDGVAFDDAWERRLAVPLGELTAPFIGRADLVVNKRAAGRPQDVADVDRLTGGDERRDQ